MPLTKVTEGMILDAAVTGAKIVDSAVTTTKIADGSVTTVKVADSSITTAKIADGSVTASKLAAGIISGSSLSDGSVTSSKIADNAVIQSKIPDGVISQFKLADGSVTTPKIVDAAVTTEKLADSSITTAKLQNSSVTSSKIADGSITSVKLASGAVFQNPMTSSGDLIVGGASGAPTRVAAGANGQLLSSTGSALQWVNAPATGANTALNNLTTTSINQDLNLSSGKVLVTNGATKPSYTQSGSEQMDAIFRGGIVSSDTARVFLATNSYLDAGTWKRSTSSYRPQRVGIGYHSLFDQSLVWEYAATGSLDSSISWVSGLKAIVDSDGGVQTTLSGQLTLSGYSQLVCANDSTGAIGGRSYYANRFGSLDIGNRGSFGARKINTGTGNAAPAGVLSCYGKESFSAREMRTPYPNNSNQVSIYDGNSGGIIEAGVGDYVSVGGVVRKIVSMVYNGNEPLLTLDGPVGNGGYQSVLVYKPAFVAFNNSNQISFEVSYDGEVKTPNYVLNPKIVPGGNQTSSFNIDWATGPVQEFTLNVSGGAVSLSGATWSNPIAGGSYLLKLVQGATPTNVTAWPASVKWGAAGAPTLSNVTGKVDIVNLVYDGTSYYATYALGF